MPTASNHNTRPKFDDYTRPVVLHISASKVLQSAGYKRSGACTLPAVSLGRAGDPERLQHVLSLPDNSTTAVRTSLRLMSLAKLPGAASECERLGMRRLPAISCSRCFNNLKAEIREG